LTIAPTIFFAGVVWRGTFDSRLLDHFVYYLPPRITSRIVMIVDRIDNFGN